MQPCEVLTLSPRKVAYLKFLHEKNSSARTGEIAEHFAVDPSTVTKAVGELARSGLVVHKRYTGVSLTQEGQECAEFLVRRHRILGLILTHYGLSGEEACREVERFESHVSRDAVNRMCQSLGHPTRGICGSITHDSRCCSQHHGEENV